MANSAPLKRIFHPWHLWEDYAHNLYGGVGTYDKAAPLEKYAAFLRDLPAFEAALKHIIENWHYSCEHNLTNESMNRIAYLGQAAMALIYNVPQSASMGGYNLLTSEEQQAADALAQKYLDCWLESRAGTTNQERH